MNHLFNADGIILKNIKLNESDKIVTIFTRQFGKIRAIAKGVRKTKSQFGSSLENLTQLRFLAFKGKSLNTISQTEIEYSFFPKSKDLMRYGAAIQCAEIIDKITEEEDPNEIVYKLFSDTLMLLSDEKNIGLLFSSFQWKLFSLMGYQPELNKCADCNCHIENSKNYIFDIAKGGIICNTCQNKNDFYQIRLSSYCLKLLKRIIYADLSIIHNKKVSKTALNELIKITTKYMSYHFEIENRTKQFMDKIKTLI
jgi:DNA repair protein RecO (recombination protein O)